MKIIADTHIHSIATGHAFSTVGENIAQSKKMGLKFMAITDHAYRMFDAVNMNNMLHASFGLPRIVDDVVIMRGVEANIIDYNGNIDVDDHLIKNLDWVIASFHNLGICEPSTAQDHTNAYMNIANNPYIDVIGHSGSCDYPYDYEKVIAECHKTNTLIEINEATFRGRPKSVPNCREIAKLCKKYGTKVVINTDSHFYAYIGKFDNAIAMLEEIDFPEHLIVNSSQERFIEHLKSRGRMKDLFN